MHHPLLALDIENDPETGAFICAGLCGEKKYKTDGKWKVKRIEEYFDNQQAFLNFLEGLRPEGMKEIPTKIIVFNASYDYWFIIGITDDSNLLTSGSSIISGKLKNGIPIMDLTNLTRQGSLEDWIKYLDMNKQGVFKVSLDDLKERVMMDAKATWILGDYLENFFVNELGIPLKLTIASAARYLFTLRFFTDYWFRPEKKYWMSDYERKAYRGGRVECFIRGIEDNFSYDVNSMYLSVMRDELIPDPNSARYIKNPKELPEGLYIADVTVKVPNQYIPPLPFLHPENGKLIFPVGTFRGHFASPELNYAIKECGVEIVKIHSYIKYKGKPYFKEYANFIWGKRKEYKDKGNKGMDILIKYLGNTLYGGFGQRNKDTFFGKAEDFIMEEGKPFNAKTNIINGVEYITATFSNVGEDSSHTFPCVPVFISSYARRLLLEAMRANQHILIYDDTDSMKLRKEAMDITIGNGLGEWGFEGRTISEFFKPKMYGDKCKGVPKRAKLVWNDEERMIYTYDKPNKMRESFRRGLTPALWNNTIKDVIKSDDKRTWLSDKHSIPINIQDVYQKMEEDRINEEERQKIKAVKEMNKNERRRGREIIRDTDIYEVDKTLIYEERIEDALNEAKRYIQT